jgi:hypothetical protein
MADINLEIGLDDSQLFRALNRTEKELKDVQVQANKTGASISKNMKDADKATEQLNRELAKTDAALGKAEKSNRSFSSQLRSFRRDGAGVFAGIAAGAVGVAVAVDKAIDAFVPLAGAQKRTADAAQGAIAAFVEERNKLNDLAIAADDNKRSDEERELAKKALINQYKEYLPTIEEDLKTTNALTLANTKLKDAIIERTATQATEAIKAKLVEDIGLQILEQRQKQIAAITQGGLNSTIGAIRQIQSASAGLQEEALKQQLSFLDLAKQDIKAVLQELDGDILGLGKTSDITTDELTKLANEGAKPAKAATKEYKVLAGSIADLEKQLAAVNQQIREQTAAGDVTALTPLIEQAKGLEDAIKKANDEIEKIKNPPEAGDDLGFLDDLFSVDAAVQTFEELEEELNNTLALQTQLLEQSQAEQLAALKLRGATEKDLTDLQSQQEKERQRLALETEQKKLEFALQYGGLRSQAEKDLLKSQIDTIKAELSAFDAVVQAESTPEKRKGLAGIFGLDPESDEWKAIEQGYNLAIENINNLFAAQLEAANAAVQAREENIDRLSQQLAEELELNEQGFANNVELVQQQLAEERKAREKALADQRRARLQQLALETLTQASNLATASSQIFSTFAGLPFGIGIPIAASVIAAMIGSFIGLKVQAFKAASQRFNKGGQLPDVGGDGRSDYGNQQGHRIEGTDIMVGGGEYVVNARDTKEHSDFLKRLNDGEFRNVDLAAVVSKRKRKIKSIREQGAIFMQNDNARLEAVLNENNTKVIKYLDAILAKPNITSTDGGFIETTVDINKNSLTRKINLKK